MAHTASLDPMSLCSPLVLNWPLQGNQQQLVFNPKAGAPGDDPTITALVWESAVEDNGLTRTIKIRIEQSPRDFRALAKARQKSLENRRHVKRRWRPVLGEEGRALMELHAQLGSRWGEISKAMEAAGFPDRDATTIKRWVTASIKKMQPDTSASPTTECSQGGTEVSGTAPQTAV